MPSRRRIKQSVNRSQRLQHTLCSQFKASGSLSAGQFGIILNRPSRVVHLSLDMCSSAGTTVQFSVETAAQQLVYESPIHVVGTNTKRIRVKIPNSVFGEYGSDAHVVNFSIGPSATVTVSLSLTVIYGNASRKLC